MNPKVETAKDKRSGENRSLAKFVTSESNAWQIDA